jgi:hypothetical protein
MQRYWSGPAGADDGATTEDDDEPLAGGQAEAGQQQDAVRPAVQPPHAQVGDPAAAWQADLERFQRHLELLLRVWMPIFELTMRSPVAMMRVLRWWAPGSAACRFLHAQQRMQSAAALQQRSGKPLLRQR